MMSIVIVSSSLFLQVYVFVNNAISSNYFILFSVFPIYLFLTSFFAFYLVNITYNIIVPKGWVEQDSKYLSFYRPTIKKSILSNTPSVDEQASINSEPDSNKVFDEIMTTVELSSPNERLNQFDVISGLNSPNYKIQRTNYDNPLLSTTNTPILTIQIPVYTEDFKETLIKTFQNAVTLCKEYNSQHTNQMNILINDDGYFCLSENERKERVDFYYQHEEIFFIARPKENRTGRFKKASNMNYGIHHILKNQQNKTLWESNALKCGYKYKIDNCHSFEIGKFILLLDSDSRFDHKAIPYLLVEAEKSRNVGFLQIRTNAMIISGHFWENIIAFFTNIIYDVNFLYSCSNGFPAPLVGHNCVLNFAMMNEIYQTFYAASADNKGDDQWKVWDENRVSEDFVFSLQMQLLGYYGKYVYYNCGMMEGVTLNIMDEITKLEKYMYGISEIMFSPFHEWNLKGIFTHLFVNFLLCNEISYVTKYSLLSYMGSYYALALSPVAITLMFILKQIFYPRIIHLYINESINTLYSCVLVYFFLSIFSNLCVKYRHNLYKKTLILKNILDEIYYSIVLTFFFLCLPYHLLKMIGVHLLNLKAEWKTTNKENVRLGAWDVLSKYPRMYAIGCAYMGLLAVYYASITVYDIPFLVMIASHILVPIVFVVIN